MDVAPTYAHATPTYAHAAPVSYISAPSVAAYTPNYYPTAIDTAREEAFAAHQAAEAAVRAQAVNIPVAVPAVPAPAPQAAPVPQAAPAFVPARKAVPAPQAAPAPAVFSPSLRNAFDAELEANRLARAELLAIQAGGIYAEEYGSDPYVGLVRHASGAITPPETEANIEARYAILRAQEAAGRR